MSTIIYPSPIFGPVHSRRLGISLGINLLPADGKVCSFDCIYCECGFNEDHRPSLPLPTREEVAEKLEQKLQAMVEEQQLPDVLTFAGNGEPTCHPHFAEIIADTIRLRNQYCPKAKVSVLSNSTMIHRQAVHDALMLVDNNILKLDTIDPLYINKVDHPNGTYDVNTIIERMKAFNGHLIIQTMFTGGRQGHQAPAGDDLHHRPRNAHPRSAQGHPRTTRPNTRPRHRCRHSLHGQLLTNNPCQLAGIIGLLTHDAALRTFQELDDVLNLRAIGHLILDLIDYIEHTRLSVEEQTVGIGDMLLYLLVDCR